ncbi:quinidine resistance protein 2 [Penicillium pulvis]|uniref:quinidine resistance protein 2 n=1 Tax=Penicillium pulvis TaxID=1562058 RepID=UPI002548D9F2|nr:quinidine resistance protein 2 [Penicillium pulvis]KAJ5813808.1 quinidine resistance protein 2 [Penicillium pulvis]
MTVTQEQAVQDIENEWDRELSGLSAHRVLSTREKLLTVFVASLATFISPISASIFYPGVDALARNLHVSNTMINYTNTSFKVFQGIAPLVTGNLSDRIGRRTVLIPSLIFYVATNFGLALQTDFAMLIVLRSLQSICCSTISIVGTATTADVVAKTERGRYLAYTILGATVGPALGPLIGGTLSHFLGWRSVFWFLVLFGTVVLSVTVLFLPETFHRNPPLPRQTGWVSPTQSPGSSSNKGSDQTIENSGRYISPWSTIRLLREKETACIVFFSAIFYACYLSITTTLPYELGGHYSLNAMQIGISYLPYGLGSLTSRWTAGSLGDLNLARLVARSQNTRNEVEYLNGEPPFEKARLQVTLPLAYSTAIFVAAYSWVINYEVHVSIPLVMLFFIGHGMAGVSSTLTTLVIDCHTERPATAMAAANLVRCLLGAGANAAAIPLINLISIGWMGTLFAFTCIASTPLIWVVYAWGHKWRTEGHIAI